MRDCRVKVLKLREELAEAHFHGFRAHPQKALTSTMPFAPN